MKIKILTILIVLFAVVSMASVSASDELVTNDFDGNFKMDIPDGSNVNSTVGGLNQSFYVIQMKDFTSFAIEYYNNDSVGDNSDNVADYVLNEVYKDFNKTTEGNVTYWNTDRASEYCYAVSSQDNQEVVVVIGSDVRLPDCISTISFE